MAQNTVYNPVVPYVGSIVGSIAPGFAICIRGTVHPACNRFAINLQCGPNVYPRDDVLLHIGIDFIRNCVVRNSIHNMNWGPEETQAGFPFVRGAPFEIRICCEPMHFKIAINGQPYAPFEHRVVYHRASHITIDGDVTLSTIEYSNLSTPHMQPHYQPPYPTTTSPYPATNPAYSATNPAYPASVGAAPYPVNPGSYGLSPNGYPQQHSPHSPHSPSSTYPNNNSGFLGKATAAVGAAATAAGLNHLLHHGGHKSKLGPALGAGLVGAALTGHHLKPKKALKMEKKAHKKALKYGLPIAGVGLGAYALHKAHKAFSSSSSSSSSDEEE